jgi:hypothetical protein
MEISIEKRMTEHTIYCNKCSNVRAAILTREYNHNDDADDLKCNCGLPMKVYSEPKYASFDPLTARQAPMLIVDIASWEAYESPASGKVITSKRERENDFKRTKTRQYEGFEQEKKEADRQTAYQEAESDKALTKSVEMAYGALPESKKIQLQKEIGA